MSEFDLTTASERVLLNLLLQAIAFGVPVVTVLAAIDVLDELNRRDASESANSILTPDDLEQLRRNDTFSRHTLHGEQDTEQSDGDRF